MSIQAIRNVGAPVSFKGENNVKTAEAKKERIKKAAVIGISAAAVATLAAVVFMKIRKGKGASIKATPEEVRDLYNRAAKDPKVAAQVTEAAADIRLKEINSAQNVSAEKISKYIGLRNAADMNKQIAEVSERTARRTEGITEAVAGGLTGRTGKEFDLKRAFETTEVVKRAKLDVAQLAAENAKLKEEAVKAFQA